MSNFGKQKKTSICTWKGSLLEKICKGLHCIEEERPQEVEERIFKANACGRVIHEIDQAKKNNGSVDTTELAALKEECRTFLSKYELGKRIASGAQGVTFLATEKGGTGRKVVVKQPFDSSDISDYEMLQAKTHPNIVRVFEYFRNPMETYIVMELCAGGDLFGALEALGSPSQNWCAGVIQQVCKGLHYLHEQCNESHNDVKPENILLDRKPRNSEDVPRAMIGDFGCVARRRTLTQDTGSGDPRYRAPEIFAGSYFSARTDVWSLGVTLYELCSGGHLIYINERNISGWANFTAAQEGQLCGRFFNMLRSGQPVDVSCFSGNAPWTGYLRDLLNGLLNINPDYRIKLDQALTMPWFELASRSQRVSLGEGAANALAARARGSQLHMVLLDFIGQKLQGEAIHYYQEIWDKYDADDNGNLEYEEFVHMLTDIGIAGSGFSANKIDPETLFRMADRSGDGRIDFKEFVALVFDPDQMDEEDKWTYFKSVFAELAGGDGSISVKEFADAFHGQDPHVVYALFTAIDADDSQTIDYEEFADYIEQL